MKETTYLYIALVVITVLAITSLVLVTGQRNDQLTSWATIKSNELHLFFQNCRSNGGVLDVLPRMNPKITFACTYADRSVEYQLDPGK